MYPNRRAGICVALVLCSIGATAAQEDRSRTTQPATRAVALCSGLWSGGQGQ
jgi:hypothetical protein